MIVQNQIEEENIYLDKIKWLLNSADVANIELAFQLLKGLGLPYQQDQNLLYLLSNTGYKIAFCLRYGFVEAIKALNKIYIHGTTFQKLPAEIGQLRELEYLELRKNELTEIPPQIAFLKRLRMIDLENNLIQTVPSEIIYLQKLIHLNLRNNHIQDIHPNIGDLRNIKYVCFAKNLLSKIPHEICQMSSLEYLDLSYNQLKYLPEEMAQLRKLSVLILIGNLFEKNEIEAIRKMLPRTKLII